MYVSVMLMDDDDMCHVCFMMMMCVMYGSVMYVSVMMRMMCVMYVSVMMMMCVMYVSVIMMMS